MYIFVETACSHIPQICLEVRFFRVFKLVGKLSINIVDHPFTVVQ